MGAVTPALPSGLVTIQRQYGAGGRQVFGLAGADNTVHLTAIASRLASKANQCLMMAFVPAYRCGAVPEFHRIPFSLQTAENRQQCQYTVYLGGKSTTDCGVFT